MSALEKRVSTETVRRDEDSESSSNKIPILDNEDHFPEGGFEAYKVLAGSFCGMISSLAFINSSGVLNNYLQTHILPDVNPSTVSWIFSINSFIEFGSLLIIGPFFDRVGCRIPLIAGIIMSTVGFVCSSWASEVYQFILSYSILGGVGSSFIFCSNISVLSHWFLRKRGQMIGFAYIGGALGGALFPLMYNGLFPKIGFGWTIRTGALICFALLLVSLVLIKDRREVFGKDINKEDSLFIEVMKSIDIKVFKDKIYTCLVLSLLGQGFAFLNSMTYLPSYSVAHGFPQSKSFYLILVFNCLSAPGRYIPGVVADKFGRFNTLCVTSICSSIVILVMWINPKVSHTLVGLFIFAGAYGFTSGSILSLAPACVGQISKTSDFSKRTGTAFFVFSIGDLVGIPIGGAIAGSSDNAESYDHMVIFVAVCSVIGTFGALLARWLYGGFTLRRL